MNRPCLRWDKGGLATALLTILISSGLRAQLYSGSVTGVITDSAGGVVPGAHAELLDQGKGYSFTTVTDAMGRYLFNSVPPGTYTLTVESKGFSTQRQSNIILDVGQNVTVNLALQVGAVTQSIEVTGQAPLLQAQDATTGQVVNRQFINDIPLTSRSLVDLAFITPGITEVDPSCPPDTTAQGDSGGLCTVNNFISDGSRGSTADFLIDGVTSSNFEQHGDILMPTYLPSIEAVQEFTMQQSNFSSEYGFSGSTIVNMFLRSGSNQFHGSAYDFLRNSAMDANNFFNNAAGIAIPGLRSNNFGATVGGPIRKDKTFFFADYDGLRTTNLGSFVAGVASPAEKTGDFGELCGYAGGTFSSAGLCSAPGGQLWDPYTGVYNAALGGPVRSAYIPFNNLATYTSPGNPKLNGTGFQLAPLPGNLIDPVSAKYIQYLPNPNYLVGTPAYDPYANWRTSIPEGISNNQFDVKVDQHFSERDLTSVKYSQGKLYYAPINCYGNVADGCTNGPYDATAHLFAVNHTHTFSPTLLLNLTYGVTRGTYEEHSIHNEKPAYAADNAVATLGMPSYMLDSGVYWMPAINLTNYAAADTNIPTDGPQTLGTEAWCCAVEGAVTHDLLGVVTLVKGRHDLKFGAEGRMHRMNYTLPSYPAGYFSFDITSTSEYPFSGGGDPMASFLTGVGGPDVYGAYDIPNYASTQSFSYAGFVQDSFKFSHKLTLNVGLRYELNTPRSERYNRMNSLDPNVLSPLQVPTLGTLHGGEIFMNGQHRTNFNTDYRNWGPRVAFAYAMTDKTVIRGGYGIYYAANQSGAAGTSIAGYQGYNEITPWITTYNRDGATPWGRLSNPWPNGIIPAPGSSLGLMNDVGFAAAGPIPWLDYTSPYEQTWTFGVQRQLPGHMLLDLNYVGKKGTHLSFQAGDNLDYLGPQIESYNASQIAALESYVPNPFYGIITSEASSLSTATVPEWQIQMPYPQFTSFSGADPMFANSIYNALQVKVEKRLSHGLQFLATYTWSKSIDDSSGTQSWEGGVAELQDPNNIKLERGLSSFDIPHEAQFSYTYELPVGRGRAIGSRLNPVLDAIVGGWQTNGNWRFNDGRPMVLTLAAGQNLPTYGAQRPDLIGTLRCSTGSWAYRLNNYFANPDVAIIPPAFTQGTAARTDGSCRQPGEENANLSLFKEFPISKLREGARMELRLETYNALNHVQFGSPNSTVNSGSFGVVTNQINLPRQLQIALKLYW